MASRFKKNFVKWRKRSTSLQEDITTTEEIQNLQIQQALANDNKMSKEEYLKIHRRSIDSLPAHLPPDGTMRRRRLSSLSKDDAEARYAARQTAILVHEDFIPVDSRRMLNKMSSMESVELEGRRSFVNSSIDLNAVRTFFIDDADLGFAHLLQAHSCYDAVPHNAKLVVFDTQLPVKKAFYGLIFNCARAALLWEEEKLVGILSITDFIRVLLMFHDRAVKQLHDSPLSSTPELSPRLNGLSFSSTGCPEGQNNCPPSPKHVVNAASAAKQSPRASASTTGPTIAANCAAVGAAAPVASALPKRIASSGGQPGAVRNSSSASQSSSVSNFIESQLDEHEIKSWRRMLAKKDCLKPLVKIYANKSLYRAVELLLSEGIHRVPILDPESGNPLYILTYKRILKFLWIFGNELPRPDYMDLSPGELGIGKWGGDVLAVYPDTPLIECLRVFLEKKISGLPVITRPDPQHGKPGGKVVAMYTRFDAIGIAATGRFEDLDISVAEALHFRHDKDNPYQVSRETYRPEQKSHDYEGVVQCKESESVWTMINRLVERDVHRIAIVDDSENLKGLVTMSDLIRYLVIRPMLANQHDMNRIDERDEESSTRKSSAANLRSRSSMSSSVDFNTRTAEDDSFVISL